MKAGEDWEDGETRRKHGGERVWGGVLIAELVQLFRPVSVSLLGPEQALRSPGQATGWGHVAGWSIKAVFLFFW